MFSLCLFVGLSLNGVCNRSLVAPSGPGTLSRPRPLVVATQREPEGGCLAPGDGRINTYQVCRFDLNVTFLLLIDYVGAEV